MKKLLLFVICIVGGIEAFKLDLESKNQNIKNIQDIDVGGSISPGRGYSTDRQQMSSIVCFNAKVSPYGKTQSIVRFDQGSSFTEIQKQTKIDVSTKIGIGMFSLDIGVQYMKQIKDTQYSLSINYYQFVQSEVTTEMGYGPEGALTPDGQRAYGSADRPNPRFGLICGDKFISQFKTGASLILSMKLKFNSHFEKNTFAAKFGVSFGSFISISTSIQKTSALANITGQVHILAYQSGGNPAQLAKILNSSCGESYCAASCSMQKMADCTGAVNGLLKYAINNFPAQVKIDDVRTLSTFPIGFAKLQDLKWLGLQTPASLVNKDILSTRQKLANFLLSSQYYVDRLTYLTTKSNLPWVKQSNLYKTMTTVLTNAQANADKLMDKSTGGIICYNDPQECVAKGNQMLAELKQYNQADLQLIINSTQYKIEFDICDALFYQVGNSSQWLRKWSDPNCIQFVVDQFVVSSNSTHLDYYFRLNIQAKVICVYASVNMTAKNTDSNFQGLARLNCSTGQSQTYNKTLRRIPSEYNLEIYSP